MLLYLLVVHLSRWLGTIDWFRNGRHWTSYLPSLRRAAADDVPEISPRSNVAHLPRAVVGASDGLRWFETTPGDLLALRIHSRDVGGAFTIVEARVLPWSGPPLHVHHERDEIFEVLDGAFRFQCGDDVVDISAGTTIVVPRGVPHAWVNLGARPARLLFSFVPGGIDELFEKMKDTPPDQLAALAAVNDTLVVGPRLVVEGAAESCRGRQSAKVAFLVPRS